MNVVVLLAGNSDDFKKRGHVYPKYLLEIGGEPLVCMVLQSLEHINGKRTFILRKEDQELSCLGDTLHVLAPEANIIQVEGNTRGAVCTLLYAIERIDNEDELLVINGDQLITADISAAVKSFRARALDGGIITFPSVHPRWSYVLLDENDFVVQTSEKRPISNVATAGCYYYRHGHDFVEAGMTVVEQDSNCGGSYYISSTFNELILKQKRIGIYGIKRNEYISFATYQMFESYLYQKGK